MRRAFISGQMQYARKNENTREQEERPHLKSNGNGIQLKKKSNSGSKNADVGFHHLRRLLQLRRLADPEVTASLVFALVMP
jgi:hypothetical protein